MKISQILKGGGMMKKILSDIEPFKMFGNLYYVGNRRVSVHIIDTEEGLVMIDTGYPDMYDQIKNSIETLGFDIKDICAIFHSHGHCDHIGTTLQLKKQSNAKTYISRIDNDIVNGTLNLSWTEELGLEPLEPFDCDVLIEDGDIFTFGNTKIRCVSSPGHTEGVMSYFVNVEDGEKSVVAGMHGGAGFNTLRKEYLQKKNISFEVRDIYRNSLHKLSREKVDIVMGNHPDLNDTEGKLEAVKNNKSIVNPCEWQEFLKELENLLDELIEREKE